MSVSVPPDTPARAADKVRVVFINILFYTADELNFAKGQFFWQQMMFLKGHNTQHSGHTAQFFQTKKCN